MANVLIIDDDCGVCRMLELMVRRNGHEPFSANTLQAGLATVAAQPVDLVFLDVHLPDGNGLDSIPIISQTGARPEVVILTGLEDPEIAEQAIDNGAWDYFPKSASPKAMADTLTRIVEYRSNQKLPAAQTTIDRDGIIGNSRPLAQALKQAALTVGSDAAVLITGETGTGKELFAQAIHRNSTRRNGNFVVVDCAALPETLVESMLFGHVKGAFTGADAARDGLVHQADGGTLFLDEVGEMPLELQKAFLRVLESHRFRPIGSRTELTSHFRVVSSTNRDLDEMVREGRFRKDLLYRLRTFHLHLPSLRDRKADIHELAAFHAERLCALYGWAPKTLSQDFLDLLNGYEWPGNIRELVNVVDCALTAARDQAALYACHAPGRLRAAMARSRVASRPQAVGVPMEISSLETPLPPLQHFRDAMIEKAEIDYLTTLMSVTAGSVPKACSLSGVSRSRLYELLKKHAIGSC